MKIVLKIKKDRGGLTKMLIYILGMVAILSIIIDLIWDAQKRRKRQLASRRKLVILDLNGVVCHRERVQLYDDISLSLAQCSPVHRNGPFFLWPRPDARELFDKLVAKGFDLAVWTSVSRKNAVPWMVENIFGPERTEKFLFVWCQEDCVKDGEHPLKPGVPNFTKPLDKVWKAFPEYEEKTTLIIDDSDGSKLRGYEYCHVKVNSWRPNLGQVIDNGLKMRIENGYLLQRFEGNLKK